MTAATEAEPSTGTVCEVISEASATPHTPAAMWRAASAWRLSCDASSAVIKKNPVLPPPPATPWTFEGSSVACLCAISRNNLRTASNLFDRILGDGLPPVTASSATIRTVLILAYNSSVDHSLLFRRDPGYVSLDSGRRHDSSSSDCESLQLRAICAI
uniref:Uncharacterized protein n=1 Tax=Knipowitschia caucasica TaxID=637954 RepID=A0AAV2JWL9_KNICA